MKKVIFVGVVLFCLLALGGSAEELIQIKDDNFLLEYSIDSVKNITLVNKSATLRDLAVFFESFYLKNLSHKLQAGLPLTKADIQMLQAVIVAETFVISSFGQAFMKDVMNTYPVMSEQDFLENAKKNNLPIGNDLKIYFHLLVEFRDGRQDKQFRQLISKYATYFKPISDQAKKGDVYCVVKQVYQPFKNPIITAGLKSANPFASIEESIAAYEDPNLRPYKAIFPKTYGFISNAKELGEDWNVMYSVVSHYIKLLRQIYREISAYNSVATDQYSRKLAEDFLIEAKKEIVESLKTSNMIFVDLPFIFLTKYTYINIQRCKTLLWDDDQTMLAIANAYAISVHGNSMLNDIASSHAANCYVQLIKLLKSELGGNKEGSKFKGFMDQSRLYEIDPSSFRSSDYKSRSKN